MSLFQILIYLSVLIILFIAGLILVGSLRTKGQISRALNMTLFLIKLPRELQKEGQPQKTEKELISVMEQLLASFSNLHSKGWNKFLYGEPYLSLEMAVHHLGEEIHFYIAVPRASANLIEKQIYGLYPTAQIEVIKDYNIFNPQGTALGYYFDLNKEIILPFKTYQQLEADPLGELATALSKLEGEGEGAALQILIRPSHNDKQKRLALRVAKQMQLGHPFKTALSRARAEKPEKEKEAEEQKPKAITPYEEEIVKAIQTKASKQNFDVNIRVVVSASTPSRAQEILGDIEGAFVQFSSPEMNSLKPVKMTGRALEKLIFNFSFRLFDNFHKAVLSTEEIVSLFHFPLPTTLAPRIKFLKAKPAEPPMNLLKEGVVLGKNLFRGEEIIVRIGRDDRRRHLYIIGQTGTGKSSLMKEMVRQDIGAGEGICVIDPHGDFADHTLSIIPKSRIEDVIVFNPGDTSRPLGLNMLEFDPAHPEQKTFIVNEMLSIFRKLFPPETMGPMFDQYFRNSLMLLMDDYQTRIPLLLDVPRVLTDAEYRRDLLSRETNPLVKNFWELEAEKAGGEAALANMAPYITSKINDFVANEFLRPIISQEKSAFNFREIMDSKKILVVNLTKGKIGDINANLLGLIIVGKLLMAALARVDQPEPERKDFYLYMDEFQNFTTESIATILSEARKYKLNLTIAHQFIKQLEEKIRNAVFGNVGSMVAFRIGIDDAEFLKNQFEPVFSSQDLTNIDNFNAYVKLLINNQTSRPFNIQILRPEEGDQDLADSIREMAASRYGRPREEVEKEIVRRLSS